MRDGAFQYPRDIRRMDGAKVKTGCRTCKVRKVKCDEGRPACRRCVSTGRVCDGYGVWGGGGNFYGQRQQAVLPKDFYSSSLSMAVSTYPLGQNENQCFEWFLHRATKKLPGIFLTGFWNALLLQASMSEPAVLHAVLTLSSVHKRGTLDDRSEMRHQDSPDEQEQYMLKNYTKAINYLKPHFSSQKKSSIRVTLITCVVFVYLELLRGHFKTAQAHLQSGVKILVGLQSHPCAEYNQRLHLEPFREPVDDWIAQCFSRLYLQMILFNHTHRRPYIILSRRMSHIFVATFDSLNEAWEFLQGCLNDILDLRNKAYKRLAPNGTSSESSSTLYLHRHEIQTALCQWVTIYEASNLRGNVFEESAFQILSAHQSMAKLMADTCMCFNDESVYDAFTDTFISIIHELGKVWKVRLLGSRAKTKPRHIMNMSRSVVDIGWIPPLYYTALKCRVHRVRLQAIRLLESALHREGIWDSNIASCVARKVMKIEERDFYKDIESTDDFPMDGSPSLGDLSLPTLPKSYRIQDLQVVLPDSAEDNVVLICRQKQAGGGWHELKKEYNLFQDRWT